MEGQRIQKAKAMHLECESESMFKEMYMPAYIFTHHFFDLKDAAFAHWVTNLKANPPKYLAKDPRADLKANLDKYLNEYLDTDLKVDLDAYLDEYLDHLDPYVNRPESVGVDFFITSPPPGKYSLRFKARLVNDSQKAFCEKVESEKIADFAMLAFTKFPSEFEKELKEINKEIITLYEAQPIQACLTPSNRAKRIEGEEVKKLFKRCLNFDKIIKQFYRRIAVPKDPVEILYLISSFQAFDFSKRVI